MTEYISRQYLLNEYDRQHQGLPGGARKIIAEAPAEDVVPIDQTGCKGCKRENNLVIGSCRLCARFYKDMYEGTNNG